MKKLGVCLFIFILVSISFISLFGFVSAACPSGMVSYWNFDEIFAGFTGNIAHDSVGSNDLTCDSGVLNYPGILSNGGRFAAPSQGRECKTENDINLNGDFSIEAWVKLPSTISRIWEPVISKEYGAVQNSYVFGVMTTSDVNKKGRVFFCGQSGSNYCKSSDDPGIAMSDEDKKVSLDETWNYIAVSYDDSEDELRFYLNGEPAGTVSGYGFNPAYADKRTWFGYSKYTTEAFDRLEGYMDEVAVYSSVLSASDIESHYNDALGGLNYCDSVPVIEEGSCSDEETLFRVYMNNNSHSALWNYDGIPLFDEEGCSGSTTIDCGDFNGDETSCEAFGCTWTGGEGYCDGRTDCLSIRGSLVNYCNYVTGCWLDSSFTGECLTGSSDGKGACSGLNSFGSGICEMFSGCSWEAAPGSCSGGSKTCEDATVSNVCNDTSGCTWSGEEYSSTGNYNFRVCAPEGASVDNHSSGEVILWLAKSYNSHVSTEQSSDYSIPVYSGNLNCDIEYHNNVGVACSNGGTIIASLYKENNSHVSLGDAEYFNYKLCCQGGVSAGNLNWEDFNGNVIGNANLRDTVKLVANGASLNVGDKVEFYVYEDDDVLGFDLFDDEIFGEDNPIIGEVVAGGDIVAYWTIELSDLSETDDYDGFFFKTNVSGSEESNRLNLSLSQYDDPLVIEILEPECGFDIDLAGTTIFNIRVSAEDSDDLIEGYIYVDGVQVSRFTNGITTVPYDFNTQGNIQIIANGTNTRGHMRVAYSNVMVIDYTDEGSRYLAACVSAPVNYQSFTSAIVNFSANTTKAWEVSSGALSGISLSELYFKWTFSDGRSISTSDVLNGLFNSITDRDDLWRGFTKVFGTSGRESSANLEVDFDPFV